jgi:hypothetical protein
MVRNLLEDAMRADSGKPKKWRDARASQLRRKLRWRPGRRRLHHDMRIGPIHSDEGARLVTVRTDGPA